MGLYLVYLVNLIVTAAVAAGVFAYWVAGRSSTLFPAPKVASLGCDLATAQGGNPPSSPCRPNP